MTNLVALLAPGINHDRGVIKARRRGPARAGSRRCPGNTSETEISPMKKVVVVAGALLLGSGAVMADQKLAVEQDNFMRALGKSVYVTMLKMSKGDLPYDQAAV